MERRRCGKSLLELSVLGIGAWSFGGGAYWGAQDEKDDRAVVAAALDAGVNYFDTAEGYNEGRSEEALGKALQGRRAEAVIGTKVSPENTRSQTLRQHCEDSLRRLGTETIDLYMVHWPITQHPVEEAFSTLQALQSEGKIRAIGVSNFGVQQLGEALATGAEIAADQLCYNLLSRAIEVEILPLCRREEIGVVGYMPLLQGLLSGRYHSADEVRPQNARTRHFHGSRPGSRHGGPGYEAEVFQALGEIRRIAEEIHQPMGVVALAWSIAHPEVTCTLVGARNRRQLDENLLAAREPLPAGVVERLDRVTADLAAKLGSNADYFESDATSRTR
jgi:aryl-alcohol dehydrogenase-like predicted oxidoreductase